ncbi:hypothetical protein BH10PLA1_BH10PLA1_15670 [soil metagenome]
MQAVPPARAASVMKVLKHFDVRSAPAMMCRMANQPRRCKKCYYVIDHLADCGACPECGSLFNLADPDTYTFKPPFLWWTFWLPALITATIAGAVMFAITIPSFGYTGSTTIVVPLFAGVLLGYRLSITGRLGMVFLWIALVVGLGAGLYSMNLAGVFCGAVLTLIFFLPVLVGMAIGALLRSRLKRSAFSQRLHLPILIVIPLLICLLEGRHTNLPVLSVSTNTIMNVSPDQAWAAIQFYEQVKHPPPWLLRLTPSFRPLYTTGRSAKVGDVKICVYERGRLVKQITEVVPGKRLAFRVIEQTKIENNSVRLIDGSFEFAPTADGHGTVVTLTTRYEALLSPRITFQPAEALAVHTLHGHVLRGMRETAEERK